MSHVGHELWCTKAKLCFSIIGETILRSVDTSEDGVLLQVMRIPSIMEDGKPERVHWDSACSGLFFCSGHADSMGFS